MRDSTHLRGLLIAGTLAALAVALGFVTLVMNQSASSAAPHTVLSLKARHARAVRSTQGTTRSGAGAHPAKKQLVKRPDKNFVAALEAGLPRLVAHGLAKRPVVVVELLTAHDPVSELATAEARAGAALAGAEFVGVDVDTEGGAASVLTGVLGKLPDAPAALVYTRPGNLALTLAGFADRTTVQQAAANAGSTAGASPASRS